MEIKCLQEFDLGMSLGQVRSVPVSLGKDRPEAVLFVYSRQENLDPWPELFNYPKDTLKMALYTMAVSYTHLDVYKRQIETGS